ncbi:MAG: hypothetical protein KTR29_09600 [Rhodothermaceae bacterium]|nr:hypothetical protein [Rhodothermaceae bacterium]
MTQAITKEDIVRAVSELPDDATLDDAFERLFVLHKIQQGLKEAQSGEAMTQEEVETHFRERRKSGKKG